MSRLEKIRNRATRARKLDTLAADLEVRASSPRPRSPDWKLQWLNAIAVRRAHKFTH